MATFPCINTIYWRNLMRMCQPTNNSKRQGRECPLDSMPVALNVHILRQASTSRLESSLTELLEVYKLHGTCRPWLQLRAALAGKGCSLPALGLVMVKLCIRFRNDRDRRLVRHHEYKYELCDSTVLSACLVAGVLRLYQIFSCGVASQPNMVSIVWGYVNPPYLSPRILVENTFYMYRKCM